MTPKEKATEIVFRFLVGEGAENDIVAVRLARARRNAAVAVELLLEIARADEHCTSREYWLLVREELRKL